MAVGYEDMLQTMMNRQNWRAIAAGATIAYFFIFAAQSIIMILRQILHSTASMDQSLLNQIIDHLTEKGQMDPGLLYESPFTDFDPLGVAGVFPGPDVGAVLAVLEDVKQRAAA